MSTTPIDYTALAKQAGATDSQPAPTAPVASAAPTLAAPSQAAPSGAPIDYTALAKQSGAIDSQPAGGHLSFGGVAREYAGQAWDRLKGMVPGGPAESGALQTIWNNLPPVQLADSIKQSLPILDAYEKARSSGASISDSIKATDSLARQHMANSDAIGNAVKAYRANPNHETAKVLLDASTLVASVFGGKVLGAEAAPEAEAATAAPEAEVVNPFRTSKIEPVVAARTAKAGLAPGEVGVTPAEAVQKTAQSDVAAKAATQSNVDQALQNIATKHAADNGLPTPATGTTLPSRDVLTNSGNALVDAGKANYQVLDKYTDGQFTNAQAELKNAQLELQ